MRPMTIRGTLAGAAPAFAPSNRNKEYPMSVATGSVTHLFIEAHEDLEAFAQLHDRLRATIIERARKKLDVAPLRHVDAEDVAQIVFLEFAKSLSARKVGQIRNRHQLMAFLTSIAINRAINEIQSELRDKRDARRNVYSDSIDRLLTSESTAEQQVIIDDCIEFYLDQLPEQLRQVAEMQLAEMDKPEIASRMGWSLKTVQRKLNLLSDQWQQLVGNNVNRDVKDLLPEK